MDDHPGNLGSAYYRPRPPGGFLRAGRPALHQEALVIGKVVMKTAREGRSFWIFKQGFSWKHDKEKPNVTGPLIRIGLTVTMLGGALCLPQAARALQTV
jgi:hypothetical protein